MQPDGVNLWFFKLKIIRSDRNHSLKCLKSTLLGYIDIGIRKSEFVAKTQFLWLTNLSVGSPVLVTDNDHSADGGDHHD